MPNKNFKKLLTTLTALFAVSAALAQTSVQSLADLLPAETFLALGTQDLSSQTAKLQPFIDEFERLDLGAALTQLFPASEGEATAPLTDGLSTRFAGLNSLDLVGQDALIALSVSSFNPLPALTLLARLSPEASAQVAAALNEETSKTGVQTLNEGDYTFYQEALEGDSALVQAVAYAQVDDVLLLSTNPDTLRGALRQLGGSQDPNFTRSAGYRAALGDVEASNFYAYLDYAQVADTLAPYAQSLGFDQLVARLAQALRTAGVSSGAVRFTDAGLESDGLQVPDANGGDAELYALLTAPTNADTATAALVPAGALSWSSSNTDLSAWWDYLDGLVASTPELGGSLDSLLQTFFGLDLRGTFLNWAGSGVTSVTTEVGEVTQAGVPSSNLLGNTVYLLATDDGAAAQTGLATLLQNLSSTVASFADPSGGAGNAETLTQDVAGVNVTTYNVTDNISLSYAVADGYAFIATSEDALTAVLTARAGGASLQDGDGFQQLVATAPADASSLSVSDGGATLASTAQQVTEQLRATAGLTGAANLDFDAVDEATGKLETFLSFVAERLGFSTAYTETRDGAIRSHGETQVEW